MADMLNADNSFDPQSRPRAGTWPKSEAPLYRATLPNIGTSGRRLEVHAEESTSQLPDYSQDRLAEDYLNSLSPPPAQNNLWDNFPTLSVTTYNGDFVGGNAEYCGGATPVFANLTAPVESPGFDQSMPQQTSVTAVSTLGVSISNTNTGDYLKTQETTTVVTTQSNAPSTSRSSAKAKSTRKNAWGNLSYADLITKAIESSPDNRLTLSQIYEWMVKNIPYFKDKGDSNSSAGWKNSIRHNLSLHAKFKRVQNEGTGKSSWWVVNYDAKQEKAPRRRAVSVDAVNAKSMAAKKNAAKRKANLLKKQHSTKTQDPNTTFVSGMDSSLPKNMGNEFRDRSGSHASSIVGSYSARDLDDDGGFVTTVGSYTGPSNLGSLPSAGNLLDMSRNPNCPTSSMPENFNNLRLSAGPSGYGQLGQGEPQQNRKTQDVTETTPHLAKLLQTERPLTESQKQIPKHEPKWNNEMGPMMQTAAPQYSSTSQLMSMPIRTQVQGQNRDNGQDYRYSMQSYQPMPTQPLQQGQMNFAQPANVQPYGGNQQQMPQNPSGYLMSMNENVVYSGDFNDIDQEGLFDPGEFDISTVISDISGTIMDVEPDLWQRDDPNNYRMVNNNNTMMSSMQPEMCTNPDDYMTTPAPGSSSVDMMMGGCHMNNATFQRMQPGQTSSVGGSQNYNMP